MEQLDYNLLSRWFVGLGIDDPVWDVTVFTKNRDRLLGGEIASKFFAAVLDDARVKGLLSDEHFSVDGTLIQAWASLKSFRPKDGSGEPPAPGRNGERDFRGEKRSNAPTRHTVRPPTTMRGCSARATVSKAGSASSATCWMENRNGLAVDAELTRAAGSAERLAAFAMVSSDIQIYELRRHPDLRGVGERERPARRADRKSLRAPGEAAWAWPSGFQGVFQVAQPVAAALDVEHVRAVQEPVEDGGRQDLIAGEQLRPVPDALVGRDDHGATTVAVADQPEEQGSLLAAHGIVAHLVDQQQRRGHVLPPFQPGGRHGAVDLERRHQLVEAEILHGEAELDGLDAERNAEMISYRL
jgi:hypothetical protein